jgi:hypothetical protein
MRIKGGEWTGIKSESEKARKIPFVEFNSLSFALGFCSIRPVSRYEEK